MHLTFIWKVNIACCMSKAKVSASNRVLYCDGSGATIAFSIESHGGAFGLSQWWDEFAPLFTFLIISISDNLYNTYMEVEN